MKERLKESLIALIAMPFVIILAVLSPIIALIWPKLLKPLITGGKCPLIGCECPAYENQVGDLLCEGCSHIEEDGNYEIM